jgi:hypothetical protein
MNQSKIERRWFCLRDQDSSGHKQHAAVTAGTATIDDEVDRRSDEQQDGAAPDWTTLRSLEQFKHGWHAEKLTSRHEHCCLQRKR